MLRKGHCDQYKAPTAELRSNWKICLILRHVCFISHSLDFQGKVYSRTPLEHAKMPNAATRLSISFCRTRSQSLLTNSLVLLPLKCCVCMLIDRRLAKGHQLDACQLACGSKSRPEFASTVFVSLLVSS